MDLLLLCRAESEAVARQLVEGSQGWPLTAEGRWQAGRLGKRLAQTYRIHALHSSPLQSAWETAVRVGRMLGLSPQSEPDLRELDSGELAGQFVSEVVQGDPPRMPPIGAIFTPFPGGESYAELHVRVVKAINRFIEDASGQTIVVVTHPGPIQAFLLAFLRYAIEQRSELRLSCVPASLHHLHRGSDGYKEIVRLNDIAHLTRGVNDARE